MDTKTKAPKEKRRNNEKRKEKSRDAARSRRSRETEIFSDLASALPLTSEQVSQLDKASIMRLAIAYLRVRDMATLVPQLPQKEDTTDIPADESIFLKSLEGFLIVLSQDGDFVYLSENVSDFLGITQIDLMGQNVYDYSHPCDHEEIKEILSAKSPDSSNAQKSFFIRFKCTLTSKGRSVNLKSATYKVIHCTGHMVKRVVDAKKDEGALSGCLVAVGKPIPHPSNIETPLPKQTFLTKHSLDMKFTHADDKIMTDILGYDSEELMGKSVYDFHHAGDSDKILSAYKCLFSKGQCETNRYRFLAKMGGYVWVVTQATLIYDKLHKPQSVVCVNYFISGVECKDEIYSATQLSCAPLLPALKAEKVIAAGSPAEPEEAAPETVSITDKIFSNYKPAVVITPPDTPPDPQTATTTIFAPRTEDMSKGFLAFSDEGPGLTMLKDEPDVDLTHLAPEAGDVCIPLDDHPFLTDMLGDLLLPENFSPLLEEPSDPFISYRDFHDPSPQLLSPNLSKNSDCSLPSLNSPSDSLGEEEQMTFMNLQMDEDSDFASKAPYIPMNMADDLPLLMSDDLMWSSGNKDRNIPDSNSSLAQLLSSSVNKHSLKTSNQTEELLEEPSRHIYDEKNSSSFNYKGKKGQKLERSTSTKRANSSLYDTANKRTKNEPKEKMSSELLQQLMSNNNSRGRPKGKSNWLLDTGGQKAACISQPSDSVLMNLLDEPMVAAPDKADIERLRRHHTSMNEKMRRNIIRKNSLSLLDPDAGGIPSLLDLTQQDCEVNAPVNSFLLQGDDLLTALEGQNVI